MESNTVLKWLRLELRSTWRGEERYKALIVATEAVNGMETAKEDRQIVNRLMDAYLEQARKYRRATEKGQVDKLPDSQEKFYLLGSILGKTEDELKREIWTVDGKEAKEKAAPKSGKANDLTGSITQEGAKC